MTTDAFTTPGTSLSLVDQKSTELSADSGRGFLSLLASATDAVVGRRVVEPEDLRGIPFIITGARFQPGKGGDFVSLECTAADRASLITVLRQQRTFIKALDLFPVVGDEEFVINDGSTGIRRQVVEWLASKDLIDINHDWDFKTAGKASVWDQPILGKNDVPNWTKGVDEALAGFTGLGLLCARGTRVSEYDYQGDRAMTVYLA